MKDVLLDHDICFMQIIHMLFIYARSVVFSLGLYGYFDFPLFCKCSFLIKSLNFSTGDKHVYKLAYKHELMENGSIFETKVFETQFILENIREIMLTE